jgi:hypothetical protein
MFQTIAWSRTRGEVKQQELIGMTAEAEVDISYVSAIAGASSVPAPATLETDDT